MKRRDFFAWLGAATVVPMVALGGKEEKMPVKKVLKKKPKIPEYKVIENVDTEIAELTNMNESFKYKFNSSNLQLSYSNNNVNMIDNDTGMTYTFPGRESGFVNICSVPLSVVAQMSIEEYYFIRFYTSEAEFTAQLMLIELPITSKHIDTPDATFYLRFHLIDKRITATVYNT